MKIHMHFWSLKWLSEESLQPETYGKGYILAKTSELFWNAYIY